jgi:hypothetical protein
MRMRGVGVGVGVMRVRVGVSKESDELRVVKGSFSVGMEMIR